MLLLLFALVRLLQSQIWCHWLCICASRDVVVLVMSRHGCSNCMAMTPYYRRVGTRFRELGIDSVVIARMDVESSLPPSEVRVPSCVCPSPLRCSACALVV